MRLGKYIFFVIVAILVLGLASCKKTSLQIAIADEKVLLAKYIDKYHKGATPTASGLYYIETKAGNGNAIVAGNYVKIFYRGYMIEDNDSLGVKDGYNFAGSGNYEPFGFSVGSSSVISGWDEAILLMKDGGEAKWIIPSKDAYAGQAQDAIPAYSSLVFYVKVYKVYRSTDTLKTILKVPAVPLN
ncbi:MAG TPA: FKBP-type peptidyl-prolyl cis-trans isomerase [Prolixibacteraceae bacterium]